MCPSIVDRYLSIEKQFLTLFVVVLCYNIFCVASGMFTAYPNQWLFIFVLRLYQNERCNN